MNVYSQENYPEYGEFIEVDEMPKVDFSKLSKFIKFPEIALKNNQEGRVIISVLVDSDGSPVIKRILDFDYRIFVQPSIEAINNYGKFIPAIKDGKNIPCWINIPFNYKFKEDAKVKEFKIDILSNNPFENKEENNKDIHKKPIVDMYKISKYIVYPLLARQKNIQGKVTVKVEVDEKGYFSNYTIVHSDNKILNKAALEAIKQYGKAEYPATKNGKPIKSNLSLPITFKLR